MEISGRVSGGVVILDDPAFLPEGARVRVLYQSDLIERRGMPGHRIVPPLVHSKHPGSVHLTNERIAEILDEEDLSA